MKIFTFLLTGMMVATLFSCSKNKTEASGEITFTATYENELYSVSIPEGWFCDDTGWEGLGEVRNMVDMHNPKSNLVSLHFVKTFLPFDGEGLSDAIEMAQWARFGSADDADLFYEKGITEVGGYPAGILYYAVHENNGTYIQKQYVTYLEDSHIVMYFNELFSIENFSEAEKMGDAIIATIKLKKVENPLKTTDDILKAWERSLEKHPLSDTYMDIGREIFNELEKERMGNEEEY